MTPRIPQPSPSVADEAKRIIVAKQSRKAEKVAEAKAEETPIEFLASLAGVLVTALFILTFVVQSFAIPSSSMENALLVGDHVFVNRVGFAPRSSWLGPLVPYRDIRRGDIVVFLSPETPGLYVVKRIIGIPGDRIRLRQGVVYRNGERLEETYVLHDADNLSDEYRNNFPTVAPSDDPNISDAWRVELPSHIQGQDIVVPPDAYFGMGDHRGVSLDSRYWGFIPRENVIGRPMFVYWSFETPEDEYTRNSAADRMRFTVHVLLHFFDETRWRRTLEPVR
jgi:signal peptidase I